ncbi:DEKNAAC105558 [Brettanomyces naardenensis]|uniref:DEKNAAC105558 n=1 Tax=Brettanomyces naardenensis TaxID=13370 RepID=A0A448YTV3_BRENA|nr:DEKNAAC105558 [Brettanomyces naardenensis]
MALSLKRAFLQADLSQEVPTVPKRPCCRKSQFLVQRTGGVVSGNGTTDCRSRTKQLSFADSRISSAEDSEEDDDVYSDLEDDCRPLKKSLSVISTPLDDYKVSRAVSQYSDDEETELDDCCKSASTHSRDGRRMSSLSSTRLHCHRKRSKSVLSTSFSSSASLTSYVGDQSTTRVSSSISSPVIMMNSSPAIIKEDCSAKPDFAKAYSVISTELMNSLPATSLDRYSPSPSSCSRSRNSPPERDFTARSRCFDYLVGAIDEVWARYCNATSHDEEIAYGYEIEDGRAVNSISPPLISMLSGTKRDEESISGTSSIEDGSGSELSASTAITDYDSDVNGKSKNLSTEMKKSTSLRQQPHCRVSEVPENMRLQKLKDRLIKAKYYLQDYVDSEELEDCLIFWKKWDLVKYSAIELVEDEDEDDVVEKTIDELETGRCTASIDA